MELKVEEILYYCSRVIKELKRRKKIIARLGINNKQKVHINVARMDT